MRVNWDKPNDNGLYATKKMIKSGHMLEIYEYGRAIRLGPKMPRFGELIKRTRKPLTPAEVLKFSANRAKKMIQRLIYANSFLWFKPNGQAYQPVTITLTFTKNIQDLKRANYEFTKFIRRLNYKTNKIEHCEDLKQSNLKYLAVFEQQKRGAIHYHCIFFNMPYINQIYDQIKYIWGNGIINIDGKNKGLRKVKSQPKLQRISTYFIKYIQKSVLKKTFFRQKKYITSKGLLKPKDSYSDEVIDMIERRLPEKALIFHYNGKYRYNNKTREEFLKQEDTFLHWMNYWHYNLSNNQKSEEAVDEIINRYY